MYAIIFEVQPKPGCMDEYLQIAGRLRPELDRIDGFLTIDRLASRRTEGRILSFSTWRDEAAVVHWREHGEHRKAQARGRYQLFADYRLRVGELIRDGADSDAATDAITAARSAATRPRLATVTELAADATLGFDDLTRCFDGEGPAEYDVFESIYTPGKRLLLASWHDVRAADAWERAALDTAIDGVRHFRFRTVRDYGPNDRHDAPERHIRSHQEVGAAASAAGADLRSPTRVQPGGRQP